MSCLRLEAESAVAENISPRLIYISNVKYGGDWHSTMHSHKCTELFYVVSGQGKFRIEELDFDVEANEIIVINSFVKEYGVSPIGYLQRKKIDESKYLLSQTDHSVSQIARIVGFSSSNYFTQSFKRMESMSPSEFRQKMGRN